MVIILDTEKLKENKLMPTQYVMLYYLHHGLDCKISPQTRTDLYKLGFIDVLGNITYKGRALFNEPDSITEEKKEDIKALLKTLVEYFPKGKLNGRVLRSTINEELVQKMKKFKKEYKYSDDIIIQATKKYSEDRKKDNYFYMRQFKYFIKKQNEGSDLADYCELILNGETSTTNGRNTKTL
jgi:hypothetical protein